MNMPNAATSTKNLQLPWRVRLTLFILALGTDLVRRSNGTLNRTLTNLFDFKSPPLNKAINGLKSFDLTIDHSSSRNLWFRLYTPTSTTASLPLILFFHGGAFSFMAPDSKLYDGLCRRLARQLSAIVISVNYRLTPEHRYPSQYEDAFDVLKFIDNGGFDNGGFDNGGAYFQNFLANVDLKRCFIAGDSAGGNIAHHVTMRSAEHEFRNLKIIGVIAIQPFFGGEERTRSEKELIGVPLITVERADWYWKAFLPEGSDREHPAARIFGPKSADISRIRFPATLVIVGGLDPLKDWQKRYYEGLKKSGKEARLIEYPNTFHGFHVFPELPESSLMIEEVSEFIKTQSKSSS